MGTNTAVRVLAHSTFISGANARTILQAAAWLNDMNLPLYPVSPLDTFGAVCGVVSHEGPVHLLQIDTFTAAADPAGDQRSSSISSSLLTWAQSDVQDLRVSVCRAARSRWYSATVQGRQQLLQRAMQLTDECGASWDEL